MNPNDEGFIAFSTSRDQTTSPWRRVDSFDSFSSLREEPQSENQSYKKIKQPRQSVNICLGWEKNCPEANSLPTISTGCSPCFRLSRPKMYLVATLVSRALCSGAVRGRHVCLAGVLYMASGIHLPSLPRVLSS